MDTPEVARRITQLCVFVGVFLPMGRKYLEEFFKIERVSGASAGAITRATCQ